MFHGLRAGLEASLVDRATLGLNHVLKAEPAAVERLRPHAGSCIHFHFGGWPDALPPLPALAFRITPIGLVEAVRRADSGLEDTAAYAGDDAAFRTGVRPGMQADAVPEPADLHVTVDVSNPPLGLLKALAGARPRITVAGDARFAADVNWLFENLRWDVEDDLARLVGPATARELGRLGRGVAAAVSDAARRLGSLASVAGPGASAHR